VLQGDKHFGFGYILPLLTTMLLKRDMRVDRSACTNGSLLTIYEPVVIALKASIKQIFADVLTDEEAKLVAALSPKFNLDWIDSELRSYLLTKVLDSRDASIPIQVHNHNSIKLMLSVQTVPAVDFFCDLAKGVRLID